MQIRSLALAALVGAAAAPSAEARVRPGSIEASAYGGVWEGDGALGTAATFGVRGAYNLNRVIGIEGNLGFVPTTMTTRTGDVRTPTISESDATPIQLGVNAVLHLNDAWINPYVTGGVGLVHVDEAYFASNVGLGVKFHVTDMVSIRTDLRGWFSNDAPAVDEYARFEATLGVNFQFGGDHDIDNDGIPNHLDRCPTQPEDKDGFKDEDGCPDPDNDGDGIPDDKDKCPDEAEDKDGVQDEDGCPDIDRDGDGIDDEQDKCPDEAEDKDGFQDADGCPDPDNDGDGIPDDKDKCPDEAESKNGFEDEDGCPEIDTDKDGFYDSVDQCKDQPETVNGFKDGDGCPDSIPEDLQAVLGIQTSVTFTRGKVTMRRAKGSVEALADVLKKYADDVEIVVGATAHKAADVDALALERAQTYMAFLVEAGVPAKMLSARGLGARELPEAPPKGARDDRIELQIKIATPAAK